MSVQFQLFKIKNIIFDFYGVLVDSEILVAKAFAIYMKKFCYEKLISLVKGIL